MKSSVVLGRVQGPGRPPVHASIVAETMPAGRLKSVTGQLFEYSLTNACQSGAAAVSEIAGLRDRGLEWSLLPIQIPTARPGALLPALGGARKPYVARSRASLAVPVLAAAGRRECPGPFRSWRTADQMGFWRGSVLPDRMLLTRYADWALIAWRGCACGAFQTAWPSGPSISRIMRGGSYTPPLASVP